MSFPVNKQQQSFYHVVHFAVAWVLLTSRVMLRMDLGLKFSPSLSAESLLIYRTCLFSADPVAKVLKFLFLCFQKSLLLVKYSEISEIKPLWSLSFETIVLLLDRRIWELCKTFSQNSLSSWDFSDDLKVSWSYQIHIQFEIFSVQELRYLCNNMNY